MPLEATVNNLESALRRRGLDHLENARQTWAIPTGTTLKTFIDDACDRKDLNSRWKQAYTKPETEVRTVMRLRATIAWLSRIQRDLRTQYGCGDPIRPRVHNDFIRLGANDQLWAQGSIEAVNDTLKERR